ncbi:MAG: RNA-binding protein [Acidimicrobiales bacterium]|nr:MAG: RNA-binding protein [Acidimicrobiales bacterium]
MGAESHGSSYGASVSNSSDENGVVTKSDDHNEVSDKGVTSTVPSTDTALLIQEGDIAADYIERLLDIIDSDGDIDLDVEGNRAAVAVVGNRLSNLVGPRGATLDALQELTRLAVAQQTGTRSRLMLDIGSFRADRRTELTRLARRVISEVRASGEPVKLSPMNPFERKIVHDVVSADGELSSESEGDGSQRRVVILPVMRDSK